MSNLQQKSAVELLQLISSKTVSSREVTQHFIDRIELVNPQINAVVLKFYDQALAKADSADASLLKGEKIGRLHGLPFTIKECLDYLDTPSTLGVVARKDDRPTENDAYVQTLIDEGGIVLGKTNVPQLMIYIECNNRIYGTTNNPLNAKFSPGGSSGGEGAIVGAGGSPVGIGTDIGGSVRFPAAFCGICSIKPTMWRTPDLTRYGEKKPDGSINAVTGILANHAEDLDLFLQIINRPAARINPIEPLQDYRNIDVSKLRVGYFLTDGFFEPMTAIKRGVLESVEKLRAMGVEVIEFNPPRLGYAEEIFYRILTADDGERFVEVLEGEKPLPQIKNMLMITRMSPFKRNLLNSLASLFGQQHLSRLIPFFGGKGMEHLDVWAKNQAAYNAEFTTAMERENLDAILSPICPLPAFLHNSVDTVGLGGVYSLLYNLLGFPAGIARVGEVRPDEAIARKTTIDITERTAAKTEKLSAGMPLSVQIAAKPWREDVVISLIAALHSPKR